MNKQNGITLITLIITIIIMLILAGVAFSMVNGDGSILEQANKSVVATSEAKEYEEQQINQLASDIAAKTGVGGTTLKNVVVNSIDELTQEIEKGNQSITVSSDVTEWTLTEEVVIPNNVEIIFENDISINVSDYKFTLQGGTIKVNSTMDLYGTITIGEGTSTINGSGMIKRNLSKTMFNCQIANSVLNISEVTLDGGVEITTTKTAIAMIRNGAVVNVTKNAIVQNSNSSKDGSAAFNVGLGTLNLDGAIIRNNKLTAAKGGAVYIRDGAVVNVKNTEVYGNVANCGAFIGEDNYNGGCTVNIYDGANIHDNSSTNSGHSGVIYLRKTSIANFVGGTFSNNSGVYSQDTGNATANISGGIYNSNNKTVFAGNNYSSIINISGNPVITVDGENLAFANGNASGLTDDIVFVTGALTEGASITLNSASIEHILSRTDGYIAKGANYTITESDVAKFSCAGYTFKLDATNNTIVVE